MLSQQALEYTQFTIYLIVNTINGKNYVGQTKRNLLTRWDEHKKTSVKYAFLLHRAIKKYGFENFRVEVLSLTLSQEEADALEKLWIISLGAHKSEGGYNMTYGGDGVRLPKEEWWKYGNACRGKKRPPFTNEHRRRIGDAKRGKKRAPTTEKHRLNLSKAAKGKAKSKEHKDKLSAAKKGLKLPAFSLHHKNELSRIQKSYWSALTPEQRSAEVKKRQEKRWAK